MGTKSFKDLIVWRKMIYIFILFSTFYFLFFVASVNAAELKIDSADKEVGLNRRFEAVLTIDSQNKFLLNALDGKILWSDNLKFISVNDADSVVSLWIQKPEEKNKEISFSGIMPGGYQGVSGLAGKGSRPGEVFKMVFEAESIGQAKIFLRDARVLLNDGAGTAASLLVSDLTVKISEKSSPGLFKEVVDNLPPENFLPETARDQNIFDGKWFLVFKTRDLGSGVDYYEAREEYPTFYFKNLFGQERGYIKAESPYVLNDQTLKSYIQVKAFDKSGNVRLVELEPRSPLQWYENYLVWIIIILAGAIISAIVIFYGKKRNFYRR